ncbi:MAG: DUF2513 domain-containing protein [Psychromonas sp.]|nr:DUF2513 domain-containing protein [Psychromonas sp.]
MQKRRKNTRQLTPPVSKALTGFTLLSEVFVPMEIDYNYIKLILEEIKMMQDPYAESGVIYKKYLDVTDGSDRNFIFHWHLIIENGLLSKNNGPIHDLKTSGLISSPQDPMRLISVNPSIRLTNIGIEFLSSLQEPEILNLIMDKFKNEGFSAIMDVSKKLAVKLISKKLESVIL